MQTAIERGDPPNIDTWQQFNYIALRNNIFDTFKEAERKSRKALMTSNLDSQMEDNDEECIGKRKRKIPKHFDSDHSSSCSSPNEDENTSNLRKPPKPPIVKKRTTSQNSANIKIGQNRSNQISNNSNSFENVASTAILHTHENGIQLSPTTSNHELCSTPTNCMSHVEKHNCGDIGGYLKLILRKQNILQCMVTDLNTKLIQKNFQQ